MFGLSFGRDTLDFVSFRPVPIVDGGGGTHTPVLSPVPIVDRGGGGGRTPVLPPSSDCRRWGDGDASSRAMMF